MSAYRRTTTCPTNTTTGSLPPARRDAHARVFTTHARDDGPFAIFAPRWRCSSCGACACSARAARVRASGSRRLPSPAPPPTQPDESRRGRTMRFQILVNHGAISAARARQAGAAHRTRELLQALEASTRVAPPLTGDHSHAPTLLSSSTPLRARRARPGALLLSRFCPRAAPTRSARPVGDETIRDDFLDVARGNESRYPGPSHSARIALLDDLVKLSCSAGGASLKLVRTDYPPGQRVPMSSCCSPPCPSAWRENVEVSERNEELYAARHASRASDLGSTARSPTRRARARPVFRSAARPLQPACVLRGWLSRFPPPGTVAPSTTCCAPRRSGRCWAGRSPSTAVHRQVLDASRPAGPYATEMRRCSRSSSSESSARHDAAYDELRSTTGRGEPGGAAMFQRYTPAGVPGTGTQAPPPTPAQPPSALARSAAAGSPSLHLVDAGPIPSCRTGRRT